MLSVRLPEDVDAELQRFCKRGGQNKSQVVSLALRRFLNEARADPFLAWIGTGKSDLTTGALMRWSRGVDWNKP